ncbi:MAG: hypothetical protein HY516_00565 [Candidatus Aenigmarchaeota archaeon]|nr:hypothetical protein [Candidatus Aenigmarchaeota archaeon]
MLASFVFAQAPPSAPDASTPNVLTLYSNGWNMISSPVGAVLDVRTINASCPQTQIVWHLNASVQKWQYSKGVYDGLPAITWLASDKGYWVYLGNNESKKCIVSVAGPPKPSSASVTLYKGWNMISNPTSGLFVPKDIADVCGSGVNLNNVPVWHFNGSAQKWQNSKSGDASAPKVDSLDGRAGYYVYATAGCTIQFQDGAVVKTGSAATTTTTTSTTTTLAPVKPCRTLCSDADWIGSAVAGLSSSGSAKTCEMPMGSETFYVFNTTFSGAVSVAVAAETNSDVDLYVYDSGSAGAHGGECGAVKCSSSKSGTAIDSCSFEAVAQARYYIGLKNYNYSGYADKGVAVIEIVKKPSSDGDVD